MAERVLVVDDEEVVLNAVVKALRHDGLEMDLCQSAGEALKRLSAGPYSLLITDLMMPGMDGLALLGRVRELGVSVPAIMITGYPTIPTALKAKRLGAFEYVTKPFTRAELRSVVARALRAACPGPEAAPRGGGAPTWYLTGHAWARPHPGGGFTIGVAREFAGAAGRLDRIGLPRPGDVVEQGRVCAVLGTADSLEHSLYTPLSGRVIEVNSAVVESPGLIETDPEGEAWLFRLEAFNAEREIVDLVPGAARHT